MAGSTARAIKALKKEQAASQRTALLCWAGVLVVTVLVWLAQAEVLQPTPGPQGAEIWQTSLLALAALLLLAEMVALALATEQSILRSEAPDEFDAAWLVVLRLGMLAMTVGLGAAVYLWEPTLDDATLATTAIAFGGGFLLLPLLDQWLTPAPFDAPGASSDERVDPGDRPAGRIQAIAMSGGGIRAASFALGGHQAVQNKAVDLEMASAAAEPHLFAVSGGSYTAAALALRRSFDPDSGDPLPTPADWREAYATDSPELERLRRHTRYIYEPKAKTRDGIITMLAGALLNLALATTALAAIVWVSAQLVSWLGLTQLYTTQRGTRTVITDFRIAADLDNWKIWGGVPLIALLVALGLTLCGWLGAAAYDAAAQSGKPSVRGERLVGASAVGRPIFLALALGWTVLVLGLPAAATGVAEAATQNWPTATVARGITTLGLVTPDMCSSAFRQDAKETLEVLHSAAETGVDRTGTAGACGAELKLSSKDEVKSPKVYAGLEDFVGLGKGKRLAGLGALLLSVLGLLRWASTSLKSAEGSRLSGIWQRLMVWVPLLVTAGVAGYLALFGMQRMLLKGTETATAVTTAVLGASVIGYFLNANITTMHNFYRARLSDAFAVGVLDGVAEPLKQDRVYRFSDTVGRSASVARQLRAVAEDVFRQAQGKARRRDLDRIAEAAEQSVVDLDLGSGGQRAPREVVAGAIYARGRFASIRRAVYASLRRPAELAMSSLAAHEARVSRPVRLHIVATLNTQAPNETATMRGGIPMVFGSDSVQVFRGTGDSSAPPTRRYEDFAGPGRVSIMAAVAISGAAVSPLTGRNAARVAPYRFLLALFNVRLGTWVLNPSHTPEPGSSVGLTDAKLGSRPVLWMSSRPGAAQMLKEAAGSSSEQGRWVYVSDGGHLDNTGLVEAVRHTVSYQTGGRVLCLDASNDAPESWQAVGDAISVVRSDLGVSLVRKETEEELPPWARLYRLDPEPTSSEPAIEVLAVKAVRVEKPKDGEDAEWWDALPSDIQAFQKMHKDFPRASTTRQKFGDLEFEAYRQLGYVATTIALESAGWIPKDVGPVAQSGLSSEAIF